MFTEQSVPGSVLGVDGKAQKRLSNHGQQAQKLRNASISIHQALLGLLIRQEHRLWRLSNLRLRPGSTTDQLGSLG